MKLPIPKIRFIGRVARYPYYAWCSFDGPKPREKPLDYLGRIYGRVTEFEIHRMQQPYEHPAQLLKDAMDNVDRLRGLFRRGNQPVRIHRKIRYWERRVKTYTAKLIPRR